MENYAKVKEHVSNVLGNTNQKLEDLQSTIFQELKLNDRTDNEVIEIVGNQLIRLNGEIQTFPKPEYIYFAEQPEIITKLFYNYAVFKHDNDNDIISNALYINKKRQQLTELLYKKEFLLPPFELTDFKNGKYNPIFYALKKKPFYTIDDEYFAMRTLQNDLLIQAITLESNSFAQEFLKERKKNEASFEDEINAIDELFQNASDYKLHDFLKVIDKINCLKNSKLPDDLKGFMHEVADFSKGIIHFDKLTWNNLNQAISNYQAKTQKKNISPLPIWCYSMIIYSDWLEQVKTGENFSPTPIHIDYKNLYENSFDKGIEKAENIISEYQHKYSSNSEEIYQLEEELNQLHKAYTELNNYDYFNLLDNESALSSAFISNCIFNNEPRKESDLLINSIALNNQINFIIEKLAELNELEAFFNQYNNLLKVNEQFILVILSMVPDSLTINKITNFSTQTLADLKSSRKPFPFIVFDILQFISNIHSETEKNFLETLENSNDPEKREYTSTLLKKLKTQKLNLKNVSEVFDKLIKLLQIQYDYTLPTSQRFDIDEILSRKKIEENKLSFNSKKNFTKDQLHKVTLSLNNTISFLNEERTEIDDFVNAMFAADLTSINKPIWLGCPTNQFCFVILKLKPYFENLKETTIERSALFYTEQGTLINANNLYRNKKIPLKEKVEEKINNIFKQLQK